MTPLLKIFDYWYFLCSDCRFQCDKNGTLGGVCEKEDGYCRCEDGFYGDKCDKGKR